MPDWLNWGEPLSRHQVRVSRPHDIATARAFGRSSTAISVTSFPSSTLNCEWDIPSAMGREETERVAGKFLDRAGGVPSSEHEACNGTQESKDSTD